MIKKRKRRWRMMQVGEIRQRGDEYKNEGHWHPCSATLGMIVRPYNRGHLRTRRPLPPAFRE